MRECSRFSPFSSWAYSDRWPLRPEESIVLGVLGETLQWTLTEAQKGLGMSIPGWLIDDERGWAIATLEYGDTDGLFPCPNGYFFSNGVMKQSICGLYCAASLNRFYPSGSSESHQDCTHEVCYENTIHETTYETRHVLIALARVHFLSQTKKG